MKKNASESWKICGNNMHIDVYSQTPEERILMDDDNEIIPYMATPWSSRSYGLIETWITKMPYRSGINGTNTFATEQFRWSTHISLIQIKVCTSCSLFSHSELMDPGHTFKTLPPNMRKFETHFRSIVVQKQMRTLRTHYVMERSNKICPFGNIITKSNRLNLPVNRIYSYKTLLFWR